MMKGTVLERQWIFPVHMLGTRRLRPAVKTCQPARRRPRERHRQRLDEHCFRDIYEPGS
ncbi:MAG: hypothetical protein ACREFQ_03905 [Stellaceae bacterium]